MQLTVTDRYHIQQLVKTTRNTIIYIVIYNNTNETACFGILQEIRKITTATYHHHHYATHISEICKALIWKALHRKLYGKMVNLPF